MADNTFSDSEIDTKLKVDILRLQSSSLEWGARGTDPYLDDRIVSVLAEALDAHALAYLCKVNCEELVSKYLTYLRGVGTALIQNAESYGFLGSPYSEEALRKTAESSGRFIARKQRMTSEEQERELQQAIETLRVETMPKAVDWQNWKTQVALRIETSFEAAYRKWEAHAIECAQVRKGGWFRRLQLQVRPETDPEYQIRNDPWRNLVAVPQTGGPSAPATPQEQPVTEPDTKRRPKAQDWEDIELSFVGDHDVEIRIGGEMQKFHYKDLPGMEDQRSGNPSELWALLRTFATLPNRTMPNVRATNRWVAIQKRIERTRKALRKHFGLTGDPFPYDTGIGYRARLRFKPSADNTR